MSKLTDWKKEIEGFLKSNWLLLIFAVVLVFLVFGRYLLDDGIKIDTVYFVVDADSDYNWLLIGRFGLVLLRYFLNLGEFNAYFATTLFMLFTMVAEFCWIYFVEKHIKKPNKFLIFCSLFLIFGCPIFMEQAYFMLQYAEVMLGIILVLVSAELTFRFMKSRRWQDGILPVILNVLTFGIYQSFIVVYLILIFATYILEFGKEQKKTPKSEWKAFLPVFYRYFGVFFVSFLIYFVIYKCFSKSEYLTNRWGTEPVSETIYRILYLGKEMVFGNSLFFDLSFLVMGILLIGLEIFYSRKQNWVSRTRNIVATILFLMLPFSLIIVTGERQPVRAEIGLSFAVAIGFLICYERMVALPSKRTCLIGEVLVGIIMMIFAGHQFKVSSELLYGEEVVRKSDILLANEIYHDVDAIVEDVSQYQLVIIGQNNIVLPESAKAGEVMGKSFFNFLALAEPYYVGSSRYVEKIYEAEGKRGFRDATREATEEALLYIENNGMENFPEKGSIVVLDNLVIVKISDDRC